MLLTPWLLLTFGAATGAPVADWPVPEEPMELSADILRYTPASGVLTADGHVVIHTRNLTVRSDHLTYDQETGEARAQGNASMASGMSAALADAIQVNVHTLQSSVERAYFLQKRDVNPAVLAAATPEQLRTLGKNMLAMKGQRIRRRSSTVFDIDGLTFTPCDCDPLHPSWRIQSAYGHVVAGEHAFLLWPVIYVGPVPVLAFPVLDLPLTDRRTGLLIPRPGVDPKRGFSLEEPIFITLGRSYDLTVTPGYFFGSTDKNTGLPVTPRSVQGPRLVSEFRYAPTLGVVGAIRLGLLYDLFPKRDPALADCLLNSSLPGCATRSGIRGLRGEFAVQHQADLGSHFYTRIDASLVSDGYYLGDLSTDLFTQGTPYLRSTASVNRRDDETYVGLNIIYRQDLRYGFQLIGPVDRTVDGTRLYGPNTLQQLPSLVFAIPETPIWGRFMGGFGASLTRVAPLSLNTGDEGSDGVFICPSGMGALDCDRLGQSNRRFDPGERQSRLRLDFQPRFSYPFSLGRFLRVTPSVSYREDIYYGEATGTWAHRGYGIANLELNTQIERTFSATKDALHHSIQPTIQLRYVPRVFGTGLGSYDEIDVAVPNPGSGRTSLAQAIVEVRQRLYQGGREWLRLDLGQDFDLLQQGGLADTFGRLATQAGPFRASGLARFDPVRRILSQLSAQARYTVKGGEVYAQYDTFAIQGSDILRTPLDGLVGPRATATGTDAQQLIVGARYLLSFGLGLGYEAVVVPQAPSSILRLAQQRIGLTLAPACNCWSLDAGVRLIPNAASHLQVNFEANLTIAHFGSIGTGG